MKVEEATPAYLVPVNGMRPIHPGEVLREEFLTPYQLTAHALSMALQVPAPRINDIVREKRAITVDTALRLAKFFGNSAEFWMGLQTDYDMAVARQSMQDALDRIREYQPAQEQ
jgi:addiction module HigA family antidote